MKRIIVIEVGERGGYISSYDAGKYDTVMVWDAFSSSPPRMAVRCQPWHTLPDITDYLNSDLV
jgi:hypothetical protein